MILAIQPEYAAVTVGSHAHITLTSLHSVITDCLNRVRTLEFGNLHTGLYNSISPLADHAAIKSVTFKSGNFMISL